MKKCFSKIFALALSAAMIFSAFAVTSSADSYGSETLLSFSADKAGEGSAIGSLTYNAGSVTLVSDGTPQDYQKGEYIKQSFTISASEAEAALSAVKADRAKKRIATDVTLSVCECVASTSVPYSVNAVEVQMTLYGKTGVGAQVVTKSSAYMYQGDTKTVVFDIPSNMVSVDTLVVCFENNMSNMSDTKYGEGGPKNITATFTALKVYNDDDGVASQGAAEGCAIDWSQTAAYSMLGSGPVVQKAKLQLSHNNNAFSPVGGMNIASDESCIGMHSGINPDTGEAIEWVWEDAGVQAFVSEGVFKGYDGMSFYILVDKDEQYYKHNYPDWIIAPFSVFVHVTVPARSEEGDVFYDEDFNEVDSVEDAYIDKAIFKTGEIGIKNAEYGDATCLITAGEVYQYDLSFTELSQASPWPEVDLYYWETLADEDPRGGYLSDYITGIELRRGTMANDCYINYTLSDIYGMKDGVSLLPELGSVIDPVEPAPVETTTTT
ncbi:MAG: hypothetical protein II366_00140, partial [Clostridia bacterium]|nr:hypothetical protein [Clostridia bacterium]